VKQNVMIVGMGTGGTAVLKLLSHSDLFNVVAVVDIIKEAKGIDFAKSLNIPVLKEWKSNLTENIDVVFNTTGDEELHQEIVNHKAKHTLAIPGTVAKIIANLVQEKEPLFQ
jgi:NADH/NAD ratio-sensing transcriptional regulator Rex